MSNRRELEEILGLLLAVNKRHKRPFSLVLVVIDYFQRIRESCGEAVVKPLLKAVARLIEQIGPRKRLCRPLPRRCVCRRADGDPLGAGGRVLPPPARGRPADIRNSTWNFASASAPPRPSRTRAWRRCSAAQKPPSCDDTVLLTLRVMSSLSATTQRSFLTRSVRIATDAPIPLRPAVLLGDQSGGPLLRARHRRARGRRMPPQRLPNRLAVQRQVGDEALVRTPAR